MDDRARLLLASGVAEWQTAIEHALAVGDSEMYVELLLVEQEMLMKVALAEGYLFYPGHTDLAEGPALARRYCTEHQQELEVLNRE